MSEPLHLSSSNKRLSLSSLSPLSPSKKPKPSSPPPDTPSVLFSDDDIFASFSIHDDDQPEDHQQLISNLLLASSSSPSKTTPFPYKVRFVSYPYLPLSPVESSSSYITINGNEETCGSSFSDADSSLMASVDTCGAHASGAFGFLSVQNGDVFGSDGMMMRMKKEISVDEEDIWDWSVFLEEKTN